MAINVKDKIMNIEQLEMSLNTIKAVINNLDTVAGNAIKYVDVSGNTVSFYTQAVPQATDTPVATFDFPKEIFLDAIKTTFVPKFTWSNSLYPGSSQSTGEALNGKPVLVLGVRTTSDAARTGTDSNDVVTYSFIDMQALVDIYTVASDSTNVLKIDSATNQISLVISTDDDNSLVKTSNGLKVDITGKADRVTNANAGDIAILNSNGNLVDSGFLATDIVRKSEYLASNQEVADAINRVFGAGSATLPSS